MRPNAATAISPAIRDTALLTPEATPALFAGTDCITAVVSGATLMAIPTPRTATAGKKVVQYEPSLPDRRKSANPDAATKGPIISGSLAPYRATSPPDHRESIKISTIKGSNAAPA